MTSFNPADAFIHRSKEFQQISDGLQNYHHVIIEGQPGIGKTTLVKFYGDQNPLNFDRVIMFNGYGVELGTNALDIFFLSHPPLGKVLLIIDDFEEIKRPDGKAALSQILKEGRKMGIHLLLTRRPTFTELQLEANTTQIVLEGLPDKSWQAFMSLYFDDPKLAAKTFAEFNPLLKELKGNPTAMRTAFEIIKEEKLGINELRAILTSKIQYTCGLIDEISDNRIVLLQTPSIIQHAKVVNRTILERIERNPKAIFDLTPRQFEMMTAELFEELGYETTLTPETRDGGKDLILVKKSPLHNFVIYTECKRYAPDIPVGVSVVRELYGAVSNDRVNAGIIVTSSYFSPDAKTLTREMKQHMSLVDYVRLSELMKKIN